MSARRKRVLAVMAVGLLGAAGCGGNEEDPEGDSLDSYTAPAVTQTESPASSTTRSPKTSATSPSPTSSATSRESETTGGGGAPGPTQSVSAPASEASAVAFVKKYFATYSAAAKDPSKVGELDGMTLQGCRSCKGLRDEVAAWGKKGGRQDGNVATITKSKPMFTEREKLVNVWVHQHPGKVRTAAGETVETIAEKRFVRAVTLGWRDGWKIEQISKSWLSYDE